MSTNSIDGRPWAKLSRLRVGDVVTTDGGFTCLPNNARRQVRGRKGELFIECECGQHFLDGQLSDVNGDSLVGLWPKA